MTASEYPVTFPFKGQDGTYYGPNGSLGLYHLGDDRRMPRINNQPKNPIPQTVYNGSTLLGKTGVTGTTSGHHLHSAKYKLGKVAGGYYEPRYNQTYFKPSNIFNAPGVVIQAGPSGGSGGTLVRWVSDDDYRYEHFHLSSVNVKVGDRIGYNESEEIMPTEQEVKYVFQVVTGSAPTAQNIAFYTARPWSRLNNWAIAKLQQKYEAQLAAAGGNYAQVTEPLFRKI